MTRQEKIKEVNKIENEIKLIQHLKKALDKQLTAHPAIHRTTVGIRQTTTVTKTTKLFSKYMSFEGENYNVVELEIPDKLIAEIAAKCIKWEQELERRADELVTPDKS